MNELNEIKFDNEVKDLKEKKVNPSAAYKQKSLLFTLEYAAPQGEVDPEKIEQFIIESELYGNRRPSLREGWWKLTSGHWAKRKGARFIQINKDKWSEVTLEDEASHDTNKIGKKPFNQAQENIEKELSNNQNQEVFDLEQ